MKVLVLLSLVALSVGSAIPSSRRILAEESGILRLFGPNGKEVEVFQSPINPSKVEVVIRSPFAPARYLQIDNSEAEIDQLGLLAEIIKQNQGVANQQSYSSVLARIQNLVQLGAVNPNIYQALRNLQAEERLSIGQSPAERFQLILQSINQYQNSPWKQQQGLFQRLVQNQQPQGIQYNPGFERRQEIYRLESIPAQQQLLKLELQIQQLQREIQQLQFGGYRQSAQQQQPLGSLVQQVQQRQQLQRLLQQLQQQEQLQRFVQQAQRQEQLQGLVQQKQQNIEQWQENRQLGRIGAQEWQQAEKLGQEAQQLRRIGAQEWQEAGRLGQEAQQLREIENAERQIVQGVPQYWRGRQGYPVLFRRGQRFSQQQFGF